MNSRKTYIILGLLIISGVLFYFSGKKTAPLPEERSDVVITIEGTPPAENLPKATKPEFIIPVSESSNDPEIAAYVEELERTLESLPTIQALQDLSDSEVHHTPLPVREAGDKIAHVLTKAEGSPKLQQEAMHFLKGCAEMSDTADAIRALCWKKMLQNIPRWKIFVPLSEVDVPQEIKDLASRI